MTKNELHAQVTAALGEHKANKATKEAIELILTQFTTKATKADEHPPVLDESGDVIELWCTKHNAYELVGEFPKSSRGKTGYHSSCQVAVWQWNALTKLISEKTKEQEVAGLNIANAADVQEAAQELHTIVTDKKALELKRGTSYHYPDAEELAALTPKVKSED